MRLTFGLRYLPRTSRTSDLWVKGKLVADQVEITLVFEGGPLDGSVRLQSIPADWSLIRYEHLPQVDSGSRHVYRGTRSRDDHEVQLMYMGASRMDVTDG